ncbi:MAG TPA: hypothetical protein VGP70_24015 [Actinomadura sp.]|nr:hypothetical protein [Actinomadura sp.]
MIVNSRAPAAHSRQAVALWVITLIGTLVQLGLCSLDLPSEAAVADVLLHAPAGACLVTGGRCATVAASPLPGRLFREALGARSTLIRHRTQGLTSIGMVAGSPRPREWIGLGGARPGARHDGTHARHGRAGTRLLIRLCVSRT